MNKDEVLKLLQEHEQQKQSLQKKTTELKDEVRSKDDTRKKLKNAYDLIKRQFEEAEQAFAARRDELRSVEIKGRTLDSDIESLQRQLARIIDAERINQDYKNMVDALREGSLSATWRGENRDDGFAAYEYQIDGAIHLAATRRAFLGDKRGLGKSLTSLITADLLDSQRTIIISPAGTMNNYVREIVRWTPHRAPIKLGQMPKGQRDFFLRSLHTMPTFTIILNYEAWRRDPDLIQGLIDLKADTVIVDEAHHAKEFKTVAAQGIRDLVFGTNQCPACDFPRVTVDEDDPWVAECACGYVGNILEFNSVKNYLPMTGTPILNKPQELFPHLHIIDPKLFPDEKSFLRDFAYKGTDQHWRWQYGAEQNLMEKIGPRYLARDRKMAGIIVPPNAEVEHIITMEDLKTFYPLQHEAYLQARDYAQIALDPDNNVAMSMAYFITVLMRLRQILVWPNAIQLDVKDKDTNEYLYTQKLEVYESAKLDKAQFIIEEILEEGDRVVLFSQFKPGLHELQRRLGSRSVVYDGSTSTYRRNDIELDFDATVTKKNFKWDVALINYRSGGEGLNFTGASNAILLDREWNPGKEEQAIGRIDRLGQTRDTLTNQIIVESSVDEFMKELIEAKRNLSGSFEDQAQLYQSAYDKLRNGEI